MYFEALSSHRLVLEKESQLVMLKERFASWGTEVVAFDVDDTLLKTKDVFLRAMLGASKIFASDRCRYPSQLDSMALAVMEEYMYPAIISYREYAVVQPSIMDLAVWQTARCLGLGTNDPATVQALERIRQIYTTDIPEVYEGALETVTLLKQAGLSPELATHADPEWTWFKIKKTGFAGVFDRLMCFSTTRPKAGQWRERFSHRILPRGLLVIGDDWWADIIPAVIWGARAVWVKNGREKGEIYGGSVTGVGAAGEAMSGRILEANSIKDVIPTILRAI